MSNGGAWNGSVLALKNGLLVMAVAVLLAAATEAAGAGGLAASFGVCEQAARAIVVAITIMRRRNIGFPKWCALAGYGKS
ncbi:hypothetical protein GCM10009121_30790 [Rhodanobacter soli]